MKTSWILLIFVFALALESCGPAQTVIKASPTLAPEDTNMVPPVTTDPTATTTATTSTTVIVTDAWKTYQNTQAGYSVQYPAYWTMVNESVGTNGELITMFMSPTNGLGITVSVLKSEAAVEENSDMPNTRCEQVTISGLSGRRCFDTLAFNFSTTILDPGKQYTIASFGKHLDQNIYHGFLESFTVTP